MRVEWKSCFRIGVSIFVLYLCITYWPSFSSFIGTVVGAAMPLLIGCVIAYILNILMSFYEKHYFPKSTKPAAARSRRPVCMLAAFASLVVIVALLAKLVVPELMASVELLIAQIPGAIRSLLNRLENSGLITEELIASLANVDWQARVQQIIGVLTTGVGNAMGAAVNVVSSIFSGIVTALFALIFSIYLLTGKEKLGRQFDKVMQRYMKERLYTRTKYVLSVLNECFHKYIVGQCTEAVILGVLCTLGMLILNIPYATMTGAVIAFTALIPARYASSRLPGKPLADIGGKPMIVRVLERIEDAGASETWVATDHEGVRDAVQAAGGAVVMTRPDHPSGTDRLAEVALARGE